MVTVIYILLMSLGLCMFSNANRNLMKDSSIEEDLYSIISSSYGKGNLTNPPSGKSYQNLFAYGIMFDVHALGNIAITELYFHAAEGKTISYQAYTLEGSYMESKSNLMNWRMIGNGRAE